MGFGSVLRVEFAALERRLDQTKQIKQGVMQELLMGGTQMVP